MSHYTAAQVADKIGKTENWVKRNARHLPHSRAGQTYYWDDEDLRALREALRVRPASPAADDASLRPIAAGRRSA